MSLLAERVADLASGLPASLDALQADSLQALASLGLVPSIDGQAAWPWSQRLAIETLAIDAGLARQTLGAAAVTGLLAIALVGALLLLLWRSRVRPRGAAAATASPPTGAGLPRVTTVTTLASVALAAAAGLALVLLVVTPWPSAGVLLRPAVATSFHRPPGDLTATELVAGLRQYREQCAGCHGLDGRGETAEAARLPVWPPRLSGALLWRRPEGETWWRVREGMRAADGTETMPGFAGQQTTRETWAMLGALRLLASGQALAEQGQWPWPIAAPDFAIDCGAGAGRTLADWRGRRVMIAVGVAGGEWPREDPRYETVVLAPSSAGRRDDAACRAVDAASVTTLLATVAAVPGEALDGLRILVDRDGWLRARGRPDDGGWRDEDLVCRTQRDDGLDAGGGGGAGEIGGVGGVSGIGGVGGIGGIGGGNGAGALVASGAAEDGLDRLIRRIDADPVPTGRLLVLHDASRRQGRSPR